MINIFTRNLLICLPLLFSGCATSPPAEFYLLKPIPRYDSAVERESFSGVVIVIEPIAFPDYLDRPQIVTRENDYKLSFSELHRWAEPLQDSFQRVLIEDLSSRIAPGHVKMDSGMLNGAADYHLSIEVLRMDAEKGKHMVLKIRWALSGKNETNTSQSQISEFTVPVVSEDFEAIVAAHSSAVALFAETVVNNIIKTKKIKW